MGKKGSVLKNLKNNLQKHELLRNQKKPGRDKEDKFQAQRRREKDQESLNAIREAFNPFNAKFNRAKSTGGGKSEGGRPVAARSQAEMQRRQTWDAEKRLKNKVGGLVDRRFGENDKTISEQDKMVERYAREKLNRMRKSGRKSFNIEDQASDDEGVDDILTHGGKKLEFQDDFAEEDLGLVEEEEAPLAKRPRLDAEEEDDTPERPKTKAEIMQEVIAKSKMHKLERQQQKAEDDELVDNLNADFDELMADLATVESQSKKEKREMDAYDVNIQEMAFDRRADPKDRTKTDSELAEEAAERKRLAEKAQAARMEGDELDIDYENAGDDAELFGLHDASDSEAENQAESDEETGANGYAKVNIPESLKELHSSLDGESDISAKIKTYVKVATPGRGSGSKPQLHNLASALVQFACVSNNFGPVVSILHDISPNHGVGLVVANTCRDLVHKVHSKQQWGRKELLLFSLIGSLFSTSDQWHVVATSASLVITQHLSQSVKCTKEEVTTNLYLCDVLLTYQRLSKRYYPEVVGYLLRVLYMLNPEANREIVERFVRVPARGSENELDLSGAKISADGVTKIGSPASAENIAIITAKCISKAASLWRSLEAYSEIMTPVLRSIENVDQTNKYIAETVSKLTKLISFNTAERKSLQLQEFRPVGIITQAPLFDENYNPDVKGNGLDPERRELQKLKALHKKERKSTLREIRRDAEFEARQILTEKREEMAAYHDKLKRLEGQINGEEGAERNAYEREKKKRRR